MPLGRGSGSSLGSALLYFGTPAMPFLLLRLRPLRVASSPGSPTIAKTREVANPTRSIRHHLLAALTAACCLIGCANRASNPSYRYWISFNQICSEAESRLRGPDAVNVLRQCAVRIRRLPALNVEPEVVAWSLQAAAWCERFANIAEYSGSSAAFVDAFFRGAAGDPFGAALDIAQSRNQLATDYQSLRQVGFQLRAALTSRYGVEFPQSGF